MIVAFIANNTVTIYVLFQINVINDLPVGKHLVDHILTGIDLVMLNTSIGFSMANAFNPLSILEYFLFGEGN